MEIAELILLLQHEVQRSYDLVEESLRNNSSNPIYVNIEKMEIELPVVMSESEKKVDVSQLKKQTSAEQKFHMPFDLQTMTRRNKTDFIKDVKKKELTGKTIQIQILSENDQKGNPIGAEKIGRIRLTLKPLLNP
jgi:hypothetical protein